MRIILFIAFLMAYIPFCIRVHRAGVEKYEKYERLAFYNSLSDDDKESADWYV